MTEASNATFETTVTAVGNNTGIVVPDEVLEQLGPAAFVLGQIIVSAHGLAPDDVTDLSEGRDAAPGVVRPCSEGG